MFILGSGEFLFPSLNKGLGGVIFFTRDIKSKEQFKSYLQKIKSEALISPFLSIDQEGGRVERTENLHKRFLSPRYAYQKGESFLEAQTKKIAEELKDFGINLNFAPCADVNTNPNNPIIGERAFSDNPEEVINGVNIVSKIYRSNNIISCIKHFPGHGDADKDSHLALPVINLSLKDMEKIHILPFKEAIAHNIKMIMAAHLHCTCFDKNEIPASLSKNVLGYLRNQLNFKGVIISDDMVMKGVQKYDSLKAVLMGIDAGLDMFIFRDADKEVFEVINKLVELANSDKNLMLKIVEANKRISKLKEAYAI